MCDRRITPGESVGGTSERMLHLECWLKERQESRRAPPRKPSND